MTNPKYPQSAGDSSLRNDRTQNLQNEIHSRKATPDEIAYRDGYVEGQSSERSQALRDQYAREQYARDQYAREQIRESNGVANGMLIGLSLAVIAGLVASAIYFVNRSESPAPQTPVTAPASPQPQQRNTTIIERTIERTREATPDVQVPDVQVPDVQINVPEPAAPTTRDSQPAPSTGSSDSNTTGEQSSDSSGNATGDTSSSPAN